MANTMRDLTLHAKVVHSKTTFNGLPIVWRILDFNHAGYPSDSVTLIGVVDLKYNVKGHRKNVGATYRDFELHPNSYGHNNVGEALDGLLNSFHKKFREIIIPTELDISYSGGYTGYTPRHRKETHTIFMVGGSEVYPGGSSSLDGSRNETYFQGGGLNNYYSITLPEYLGFERYDNVLSRTLAISSSSYYNAFPGTVVKRGYYHTSSIEALFCPIVNIPIDTPLLSETDENGYYYLKLIDNKYLLQDGEEVKKWEITQEGIEGLWEKIGDAPATKEMFDAHGMSDLSQITHEAIQSLVSDTPELLCWTDEEGPEARKEAEASQPTEEGSGEVYETSINPLEHSHKVLSVEKRGEV